MNSQKVVMPAKAGIQSLGNPLKFLDSRLRGNDENRASPTFCGFIKVELQSTIFRKFREKELNSTALRAVLEKFECDCEDRYEVLHVASPVYDEACGLLSRHGELHGLRTLDSLQLATFLNYCEKEQDGFVCADKKLSAIVEHENVQVVLV